MSSASHTPKQAKGRLPWLARVAAWSAGRPVLVACGAVVVLGLSLFSLSRLHFSATLQSMLGDGSPTAAAMERIATDYRASDALLVLAELPAGKRADAQGQRELVEFAERLGTSLDQERGIKGLIAWVRYRQDPAFVEFGKREMLPNGAFYLSEEALGRLIERVRPERMREQIARNEAMIAAPGPGGGALSAGVLRDPLRLFELIPKELAGAGGLTAGSGPTVEAGQGAQTEPEWSDDGRGLLIRVGCVRPTTDLEAAKQLTGIVGASARRANTGGLRVELAGSAAIADTSAGMMRHDAIVSTVVSVGFVYALFVLFYRRWLAALMIGGVAAVGMLAGLGVHTLIVPTVSPLAAAVAALLAGLGVDYGIHFMSHYDGYRQHGMGSAEASTQTARTMALPIVTNCFTSIFGFASLVPSPIHMLRDFATMGAAGLLGALAAVFVLMPALLRLFDRDTPGGGAGTSNRVPFGLLADRVAKRGRMWMGSTLAVLGVVVVAAGLRGFAPTFEADLSVMHPRPNPALDATHEVIRRFSGQGEFIPVEVRGGAPGALVERAHDVARALQSKACRDAGVAGVIGLHLLLPDPRTTGRTLAQMAGVNAEATALAFNAAIAESSFEPTAYGGYRDFLRTLLSAREPPTVRSILAYPSLAERVFPTSALTWHTPPLPTDTALVVRMATPLRDRVQRQKAIATLNEAIAPFPGVTLAGLAAVAEDLESSARSGLGQSVAISVGLVLGWLLIVFRRPLDVLLAIIPLTFAGVTTVLFMVAADLRFNPINSVAVPLLDGIAVDAGVFLVAAARVHGGSRAELCAHLRTTTHAVLLAVATTVTAFAALCFTHTPAIRSLGLVAAVGATASMCGALFVLMPILIRRAPEVAGGHPPSPPPAGD